MATTEIGLGEQEPALRERAGRVIPGGMYGHMSMSSFSTAHPQFVVSGSR